MVEAYWTLGQAHRWISWRDARATTVTGTDLRASAAMATYGVRLQTDPVDARQLLLEALRAGHVEAIDRGRRVPREVWASLRLEWADDDNGLAILPDDGLTYKQRLGTAPPPIVPVNPKVPSAAVMAAWPDIHGLATGIPAGAGEGLSCAADLALLWTLADEMAAERGGDAERHWLDILDGIWTGALKAPGLACLYRKGRQAGITSLAWDAGALAGYLLGDHAAPASGLVGRGAAFYLEQPPPMGRHLARDSGGRVGLAMSRGAFKAWICPPAAVDRIGADAASERMPRPAQPADGFPAEARRWFFDEMVPAHPKGLSIPALEKAARARFKTLSVDMRKQVRALRRDSAAPEVWRVSGPKGRDDKRRH